MATPINETPGATPMPLRARIVDAAARVYGEFGFRGATTRRIADEAGVNEVSLFRTFGSKAALIVEVLERQIGHGFNVALPDVPTDPYTELLHWAQIYAHHIRERRGMIMQSMGEIAEHPEVAGPICVARDREFSALCAYVDQLRTRGFATLEYDTVAVAAMLTGAIFGDAVGRDLFPSTYPADPEQAVTDYVRLVLRAIGAPDAPRTTSSGNDA